MKNNTLICAFILAGLLLFAACSQEDERQIKLSPRPMGAIMQEQVKTVQIAIEDKKTIAVMAFVNQDDYQSGDWMSVGLMRMLNSSLEQSRQLVVTPAGAVRAALTDIGLVSGDIVNTRACQRLGALLKADALVSGIYRVAGDSLTLEVMLHNGQTGEVTETFSSVTKLGNLKSMGSAITKLSWQIRRTVEDVDEEMPAVRRRLADVSTNSLQAYKYYLDGLDLYEQFMMRKAMEKFSQAIEMDSTFASAYLYLAHAMLVAGLFNQTRPVLEKAVALAEFVPERERLPILAMNAMLNGELFKAIAIYNQAVELFPEDDQVHYALGNYYFSVAHNYKKAIEKYETTIQLNPRHKLAYNNLAYCYAAAGEMEHARYILEKYIELAPNEPNPFDSYGEIAQNEGNIEEAIEKYKQALDIDPDYWPANMHLATAWLDLGKFRKAKALLKKLEKNAQLENNKVSAQSRLAFYYIVREDIKRAEAIWQQQVREDSTNASAIFSLLIVRPDYEPYRRQFSQFAESQLASAVTSSKSPDYLFPLISLALLNDLALDKIDSMLDLAIQESKDPILLQAAISYKIILDLKNGRKPKGSTAAALEASHPEAFQFASPVTWKDYWRHYFSILNTAHENGLNIRDMTLGFQQFAVRTGNSDFELQGNLALAASDYYTGDQAQARIRLEQMGFPCESDWTFLGPFKMSHGFNERFWPEKKALQDWAMQENYENEIERDWDDLFDGYIDLKYLGQTRFNNAVYALLPVNSPTFINAQLRFGFSGRLKVWLNGETVMIKNKRSMAIIDQYTTDVQLRPGLNWMLVRVNNAVGELGFYFRLTDENGSGIDRVTFEANEAIANNRLIIPNGEHEGE